MDLGLIFSIAGTSPRANIASRGHVAFALWKVRVLPGRRDARCATAAERGGPTDNRDTPRGTIDARARLASAIARHRHRQSATTVRPPPRRRYPRHRPALATAAQATTVAASLAAAEAACSMATRWRSATGSCPTFVLKATMLRIVVLRSSRAYTPNGQHDGLGGRVREDTRQRHGR